tara:strand:- start:286 stop:843 length:558 start_codon:yes stop_codon:yes gene_type:complete
MAGKLRYAISVTPMETVTEHFGFTASEETDILTDASTRSVDVIMTEVQETLGCSSADFTIGTTALVAGTNGFADGVAHIRTAPASATALVLPTLAACDGLYIENTGYRQAANGAKEVATVNTTDYLVVATAATSGTIVASLKANEGVFLPLRGTATAQSFFIRSAAANGTSAGGQTLGAKFLSIT